MARKCIPDQKTYMLLQQLKDDVSEDRRKRLALLEETLETLWTEYREICSSRAQMWNLHLAALDWRKADLGHDPNAILKLEQLAQAADRAIANQDTLPLTVTDPLLRDMRALLQLLDECADYAPPRIKFDDVDSIKKRWALDP